MKLVIEHLLRKGLAVTLSILLVFPVNLSVCAATQTSGNRAENLADRVPLLRVVSEDELDALIQAMEPFVHVKSNLFSFDVRGALDAGIEKKLVSEQAKVFDCMNQEARDGKIRICDNKDVIVLVPESSFSANVIDEIPVCSCSCGGVTTNPVRHWWGYSRSICNCVTNNCIAQIGTLIAGFSFASALTTGKLITKLLGPVVVSYFPAVVTGAVLAIGYCSLISSRLSANNNGRGVHMKITWVAIFSFSPQ